MLAARVPTKRKEKEFMVVRWKRMKCQSEAERGASVAHFRMRFGPIDGPIRLPKGQKTKANPGRGFGAIPATFQSHSTRPVPRHTRSQGARYAPRDGAKVGRVLGQERSLQR